jgi:hypothetical protein
LPLQAKQCLQCSFQGLLQHGQGLFDLSTMWGLEDLNLRREAVSHHTRANHMVNKDKDDRRSS